MSEEVTDKVQISAMLTPERAVGGTLEKGDLVGVYLSFDPFELRRGRARPPTRRTTGRDDCRGLDGRDGSTTRLDRRPASTEPTRQKTPNMTRLEFQHVLVTNVQTTNEPVVPDETDEDDQDGVEQVTGSQYIVTLALSPEQSERFVFATEFGHVWLSNEPATVSDDGTRLVTLGNVYSVAK